MQRISMPMNKAIAEKTFNRKASPNTNLSAGAFLKKSIGGMKNKVIDKVSDVMSYPARRNAQKAMIKADQDVKDIRTVRESKGADTSDKDYRDPLFRARANVSGMRVMQEQALKKSNRS